MTGALLEWVPPHWLPTRYGGLLTGTSADGVVPAEVLSLAPGEHASRFLTASAGGGSGQRVSITVVLRVLNKDVKIDVGALPLGSADVSAVPELLTAEQGAISVTVSADPGARLKFTFDNASSMFTRKTVLFGTDAVPCEPVQLA